MGLWAVGDVSWHLLGVLGGHLFLKGLVVVGVVRDVGVVLGQGKASCHTLIDGLLFDLWLLGL